MCAVVGFTDCLYLQKMWQESQKKASEFDRVRRTSFKRAQELTAKSPDIPDKILESIPVDKQKEIIRRMTLERKPRRYIRREISFCTDLYVYSHPCILSVTSLHTFHTPTTPHIHPPTHTCTFHTHPHYTPHTPTHPHMHLPHTPPLHPTYTHPPTHAPSTPPLHPTYTHPPTHTYRQAPGAPRGRGGQFRKQSSFVRPGTVPKSTSHVISWFNKNEAPKGVGRERDGSFSIWFHGKCSDATWPQLHTILYPSVEYCSL